MVQMRKWKRGGEEEEKADPGGPTKGILSGGRSQGQCGEHPPPLPHTHTAALGERKESKGCQLALGCHSPASSLTLTV